ncbi:dienelactone hydrolase family protein [Eisenibacter elegans]|jgi:predicted peptidase|uniref:carboxylesterase family protein n=1 Tax=Eisenibacter elegans TaxID=997 RepID=UPI00041EF1F0|nr:alpha/beta hydrolase-fold protein [Eisenibacter elegans]
MKSYNSFFCVSWVLATLVWPYVTLTAQSAQPHFGAAQYQGLPYRIYSPSHQDEAVKYPLIVFLHGAGERGHDNNAQLTHAAAWLTLTQLQAKPCFVLVPQCPPNARWVETDWGAEHHTQPIAPSIPLGCTMELLDSLLTALPIDTNRLYLVGLSMGGFGTWDWIARQPHRFAAAVPICGGADEQTAARLTHLPIWAFHGALDNVVKVARSRRMIAAIRQYGGQPIYTEYPEVKHGSWIPALQDPKLLHWLFAQQKN